MAKTVIIPYQGSRNKRVDKLEDRRTNKEDIKGVAPETIIDPISSWEAKPNLRAFWALVE